MTDLQAVVMGFVQGATEWLPVSSTAHLRIVSALLGWKDAGAAFTAVIQWGTLLAALFYFRRDILAILFGPRADGPDGGSGQADRRLLLPILIGTLPVVVCGVLFKKQIEHELRSLYVIAGSLIVFALLLAFAERRQSARREMGTITVADGLLVGIGQAFALIPGASRSGTTITAALFAGLERATAARFSFLLSLPAVFAAGAKELLDHRHEIAAQHMGRPLIIATVVAFLVGLASIDWFLKFLKNHPTYGFIVYRLLLGAALLGLLATHYLSP